MKRFVTFLVSLCAVVAFTIVLGSGVAKACLSDIQANDDRGGFYCSLTGSDAHWCYYDCTCHGNCDDLYDQFGLEAY